MFVAKYALLCDGKQIGIADTRRKAQCKVLALSERSSGARQIKVKNLKKVSR